MNGLQTFAMVLFFIFFIISILGLIYAIYRSVALVKDKRKDPNYRLSLTHIICGLIIFCVGFTTSLPMIFIWNAYEATVANYFEAIIGGLIFSLSLGSGTCSFILHYYKKDLPLKLDKITFLIFAFAIPLTIISFFLATNGFADMGGEHFLLPYGISFTKGFVRKDIDGDVANITFYALFILSGALLVYALCDHYLYKEYGKHGTLDLTFITAFPAGIVGARIFYVVGEWTAKGFDKRVAAGEWWSIFAIWEGGLTILGGAIVGIIVGVLVYIKTNKGRSIWKAVDLIVPTILIAQAVGRWGNFFNSEVHGLLVDENLWRWLPRIVFNNVHYSVEYGWAPDGYLYVPLFFIEFLTNLSGYFIIAYLFGKWHKLAKYLAPGDLAFGYIIWYGYTRTFMEPLRDTKFTMGEKGYWSWFWAIMFVLIGGLLVALNHLIRYILNNKKVIKYNINKLENYVAMAIFGSSGLTLLILAIIFMSTGTMSTTLAFNTFNNGLICLSSGIPLLMLCGVVLYQYLNNRKLLNLNNE